MDNRAPFQPDFTAPAAPRYAPVSSAGTAAGAQPELLPASPPFLPGQLTELRMDSVFSPTAPALFEDRSAENRTFARSVLLGLAAMVVGALFHAVESSYSGLHFIYLAFIPGLLVGRAMKWNESVPGGRRYQVVAVVLSYLSYLISSFLILLWALHRTGAGLQGVSLAGWGFLLVRSVELPFLEITDGLMGWFEIVAMGVGIYMAWKSTRQGAAVMRSRWERRRPPEGPPSILGR